MIDHRWEDFTSELRGLFCTQTLKLRSTGFTFRHNFRITPLSFNSILRLLAPIQRLDYLSHQRTSNKRRRRVCSHDR